MDESDIHTFKNKQYCWTDSTLLFHLNKVPTQAKFIPDIRYQDALEGVVTRKDHKEKFL